MEGSVMLYSVIGFDIYMWFGLMEDGVHRFQTYGFGDWRQVVECWSTYHFADKLIEELAPQSLLSGELFEWIQFLIYFQPLQLASYHRPSLYPPQIHQL
jgi:hypothetical protein